MTILIFISFYSSSFIIQYFNQFWFYYYINYLNLLYHYILKGLTIILCILHDIETFYMKRAYNSVESSFRSLLFIVTTLLYYTPFTSCIKTNLTLLINYTITSYPLFWNTCNIIGSQISRGLEVRILTNFSFLQDYFIINDLIWQDGFLIDFLQKKIIDKWIRNFLIYSGYLFNERFLFDYVIRFYIDTVIWKFYRKSIFEFNNVASTLLVTLAIWIFLFLIISLFFLFVS